jgi:hypothetical protein
LFLKRLKWLFDFYLYGNFQMALCSVALVGVSQLLFDFHLRPELFIFVFCGTFFLYNLQRLPGAFQKKKIDSAFIRHKWNIDHKYFLAITSGIAAVAAGWSFLLLYHRSQIIAVLPALISVAYSFPLIPAKGKWKRLREIPGLKIFMVAVVWSTICVLLPATADDPTGKKLFSAPVILWFISFCAMIFSLTMPFDIRDYFYDGKKLKTIPALVGVKGSIVISICSMSLFALGIIFLHLNYSVGTISQLIGMFFWCILSSIVVANSNPSRNEYYFSFVVDGLLLVLWGILEIVKLGGTGR